MSAKCALAARVDSFHESKDGAVGDSLRADIEQKLDKLQEPPPVKTVKALPAPVDAPRKKRGGRRFVLGLVEFCAVWFLSLFAGEALLVVIIWMFVHQSVTCGLCMIW